MTINCLDNNDVFITSYDKKLSHLQHISPKKSNKQQDTRRHQKSVSFDPTANQIHSVLHINDYTDEQIDNTWYSYSEYKSMKEEIRLTVQKIDTNDYFNEIDDFNYCRRGLEAHTKVGGRRRVGNKAMGRDAVLDEQDDQRDGGYCDPLRIAKVYCIVSMHCQIEARVRGRQDEAIAFALRQGRRMRRRFLSF